MKDYITYATVDITKKAMEKGLELEVYDGSYTRPVYKGELAKYYLPTTEQICGWLREEKGIIVTVGYMRNPLERHLDFLGNIFEWYVECSGVTKDNFFHGCEKEYRVAMSAAIDKALDLIGK